MTETNATPDELDQISELLRSRADEISAFKAEYTTDKKFFASVELALSREIIRLRKLADKVKEPLDL